jgi:CDP-diacylglycerol--glycerol-3-phosphate 3-phosphatidyltransferase
VATSHPLWQIVFICWIGFSDFLDGFLARFWKATSNFGATLDQWVDKVVNITLLFLFLYQNRLDLWFVLLFTAREVIIILARSKNWSAEASTFISKAKTFFTYVLCIAIVLFNQFEIFNNNYIRPIIIITEIMITYLSAIGFIVGLQPEIRLKFIRWIATGLHSSLLIKKAPGTITTLVFFIICWLLKDTAFQYKILSTLLLVATHYITYSIYISNQTIEDPGEYTLDEIVAVAILFCSVSMTIYVWCITFLLFRFFDIQKPLGIRILETSKYLSATTRVLIDDIVAALYTFTIIAALEYVIR